MEEFTRIWLKAFCITLLWICCISTAEARSFIFVNNCSFPVWFGLLGGANTPKPADNNYQLPPGGRNTATLPEGVWSGIVAGRTNCASGHCETADCGGGTGACPRGFDQPATQAEFTINSNTQDVYDVTVINGMNLALSITPSKSSVASNPYFCGSPGAKTPSPGMGACSWEFSPPLVEYQWVVKGGNACTSNADCGVGTVCGLSFDPPNGNGSLFRKSCGRQLGYWTANQVCGVDRKFGAPFNCSDSIPQDGILWDLYACIPPIPSCYTQGTGSNCCGCVNWDQIGIPVPPGPITHQCVNSNPTWVSRVRPTLEWIKKSCPTVYTYPYDDPASTFVCGSGSGQNTVDYTITFCPGGVTPPPPQSKCLPPTNINATYTDDRRNVTLTWDKPAGSDTIDTYQVNDWLNRMMWKGTEQKFVDTTLPGAPGMFVYFLNSNCASGPSERVQYNVVIR